MDRGKLLTAREAACELGVAAPTLYEWARKRKIPHVRLGDRVLFEVEEILRLGRVPADGNGRTGEH